MGLSGQRRHLTVSSSPEPWEYQEKRPGWLCGLLHGLSHGRGFLAKMRCDFLDHTCYLLHSGLWPVTWVVPVTPWVASCFLVTLLPVTPWVTLLAVMPWITYFPELHPISWVTLLPVAPWVTPYFLGYIHCFLAFPRNPLSHFLVNSPSYIVS